MNICAFNQPHPTHRWRSLQKSADNLIGHYTWYDLQELDDRPEGHKTGGDQ